jgi:hypothetical protein
MYRRYGIKTTWEVTGHYPTRSMGGIEHDGSIMEDDFHPHYLLRKGDSWPKIDHTKKVTHWMKTWKVGTEVNIIEVRSHNVYK